MTKDMKERAYAMLIGVSAGTLIGFMIVGALVTIAEIVRMFARTH